MLATFVASSSTAQLRISLDPGYTDSTKFSVRLAQATNSCSLLRSATGLPRPFTSIKLALVRGAAAVAAATAACAV